MEISYGSYAGDNGVNKAVAHGLTGTPDLVFIAADWASDNAGGKNYVIIRGIARVRNLPGGANSALGVTAMDSTSFYVGNATSVDLSANSNAYTYYYIALRAV